MIPVHIYYSDGHYSLTRTDREDTKQWPTHGYVTEDEWVDYEVLLDHQAHWREKIIKLDNAYYRSLEGWSS